MKKLLIRAEDKNIWEQRTPLIPNDIKKIKAQSEVSVLVEESPKRVFTGDDYRAVGAEICTGMQDGDLILGVKEIPVNKILDKKIYMFFSHTIKGQQYNMPLLQKMIDSDSTLIDYEKITDKEGRRMVYFGPFAGDAGALNILWLLGEYWQHKGIETPFTRCKQSIHYHSLEEAKEEITEIGKIISEQGLPRELAPLTIGILGYGHVSSGAQKVFECLPTQRIAPEDLAALVEQGKWDRHTIYLTVFKEEHLVKPRGEHAFDLQDYYHHPGKYESQFNRYLPYLTIIINATYWEKRYPRFVTWNDLKHLFTMHSDPKLCAIADITCDVNGSIECNVKCTDSGMPAYRIQPLNQTVEDGHIGDGIVLLAIDNLPAELPRDSSIFFSNLLSPFIPGILSADFDQPLDKAGLPPEIKRAVIVYKGQLTADYQYLKEYL